MSKYLVREDFRGAIRGCYVKQFTAGSTVEIDDADLIGVAVQKGWITPVDDLECAPEPDPEKAAPKASKNKAAKAAPKGKDTATE
jgi:hypothetical protein